MNKVSIEDVKKDVEDEITIAFISFCRHKIKELKAYIFSARQRREELSEKIMNYEEQLELLSEETLREEFFKHDCRTGSSEYERVLNNNK